jgi:hypothetical protein
MPAHRHACQSERKLARQRRERHVCARAAGRGIRHDANRMPARGLRPRKVDHVTE